MIDLRSDFLTRPTTAMLEAMHAAAVRPAVFGLREDPDQRALQREVAELLGMQDALLFPTCSMANEVALMLLARPGETVLAQPDVHILTSEAGAPAALGGLHVRAVDGTTLCPPARAWAELACPPGDALNPRVAAVALENTHNRGGGMAWPRAYADEVLEVARRAGVGAHLDGARLFNAAIALNDTPARLCSGFDTVSISLNKGLGAPVGAMLAGSTEVIDRALLLRQRLGGGMRPTGMIAAAAREAIRDFSHLADDHRRAQMLARGLVGIAGARIDPTTVQTNIVVVEIAGASSAAAASLARRGVLVLPFGAHKLRLVTYRDIGDDDIARAVAALESAAQRGELAIPEED